MQTVKTLIRAGFTVFLVTSPDLVTETCDHDSSNIVSDILRILGGTVHEIEKGVTYKNHCSKFLVIFGNRNHVMVITPNTLSEILMILGRLVQEFEKECCI